MKRTRVQRRRSMKRKSSQKGTRKHRRQQGGQPGVCPARCIYGNGVHDYVEVPPRTIVNGMMRQIWYCERCGCNEVTFRPARSA